MLLKFTFWFLIFLIAYCYFGYPLMLYVLSKFFPRKVKKAEFLPMVSVVLSVCDEEDVVEAKIKNLLSLDYPQEKFEILIGSDGSKDKTNVLIKNFRESRVRLFEHAERRGKMTTLNEIVTHAKGEVIVFTDARQMFDKNAVRELVYNFADPVVGCVSGELIFASDEGATAKGINLYWEYEKFIRFYESRVHSMIGATGAIYAIRRELYTEAPANTVLDDVFIPLKIIQKGYRAIFDENAKAFDKAAESPKEEYRRKTRTLFGNYQIFFMLPAMFIPGCSPIAIQFFSHKLLRVLVPFFMIAVFFLNLLFIDELLFYTMFVAQFTFYILAVLGALLRYENHGMLRLVSKICYIPYVFCLLNISALVGFFRFLGSRQEITWEKAREK